MSSTSNEGKSGVAERFIGTLKNKIFKHMTAISKNVYFDVLDDIVNKCNNTVHRNIKMKPTDVTSYSYTKHNEDSTVNSRLVIMLGFQNTKTFLLKDTFKIVISDLNGERITRNFYEKELQKTSQEKFRIEKVLKRKGDKVYV